MAARRRLIVGSAGGTSAFGVIRSVRERYGDSVFVIAIDTNPRELVAATVLADAFTQVPPARAPQFPAMLQDLAKSYGRATYLPLHDAEILAAARLVEMGRFPSELRVVAPPYAVARLYWDKWEMHQWLSARGLPSPRTVLAEPATLEVMQRPVILKPREGTAGANFQQIHTPSELEGADSSRWVLQEVLQKPEVSVEVFLARDSDVFRCVARADLERRPGGPSTKARLHTDPDLTRIAERLARELPLRGAFNFEAMHDNQGNWRIIDVNPRVNAGTRMCAVVGIDMAAANLADFWGESAAPMLPPLDGEYYVVKQYEDYVTGRRKPADQ